MRLAHSKLLLDQRDRPEKLHKGEVTKIKSTVTPDTHTGLTQ